MLLLTSTLTLTLRSTGRQSYSWQDHDLKRRLRGLCRHQWRTFVVETARPPSQSSTDEQLFGEGRKKRRRTLGRAEGGRYWGSLGRSHYHASLPSSSSSSPSWLAVIRPQERRKWGGALASGSTQEPEIFPDSLSATLEAHRDTNRASLIRKVPGRANAEEAEDGSNQAKPAKKGEVDGQTRIETGNEDRDAPGRHALLEEKKEELIRQAGTGKFKRESAGKSRALQGQWQISTSSHLPFKTKANRPWMAYMTSSNPRRSEFYVYDYMTDEILAFEKYMTVTKAEKAAAHKALDDTRKVIGIANPGELDVSVIGSRSTNLEMPFSDIDFNVELFRAKTRLSRSSGPGETTAAGGRVRRTTRVKTINLLRTIKNELKGRGGPKKIFVQSYLIEDARVPIVCTRHNSTDLDIQIQSTPSSHASTELVKSYISEFPTLRPLFLVLRQMLKMRNLGEPKRHGIGSYALLMMIVATLKFSGARFGRLDAAKHLLYFLDFYTKINFGTTGISVDPPELFTRRASTAARTTPGAIDPEIRHSLAPDSSGIFHHEDTAVDVSVGRKHINYISPAHPHLMCLQDPANPYNDLGLQALAIKHVQATLADLRSRTQENIERFKLTRGQPENNPALLDACLAADYGAFERTRMKLEQVGREHFKKLETAKDLRGS